MAEKLRPLILTMTTIPARSDQLQKKFNIIKQQTVKPDAVEIYIPKFYRRFPEQKVRLKNLPSWVSVYEVPVDHGPATKILPALQRWENKNVDLLLCDDDRRHDEGWIERLLKIRSLKKWEIICERGWNIHEKYPSTTSPKEGPRAELAEDGGRSISYRLKRILSLGLYHPKRQLYKTPGRVDIFEGFLGALIPPNAFHHAVHEIPESHWLVDDVWLSGMATANSTIIWAHSEPRAVYSNSRQDKVEPLTTYKFNSIDRTQAELDCIKYFQHKLKIWT